MAHLSDCGGGGGGAGHGRLTVLVLAVGGWLTLSGVQWRALPRYHCVLAALPVLVFALAGVCMLLFPAQADVRRLLEAGAQYGYLVQAMLVLTVFVRGRDGLLRLERRLARLERRCSGRGASSRVGWRRRLLVRLLLAWLLAVITLALWYCFLLAPGKFQHPHYVVAMWVPETLHRPPRYWLVIGYQMVLTFLATCLAVTFDSCCYIWLDAISFHLDVITDMVSGAAPAADRRHSLGGSGAESPPPVYLGAARWATVRPDPEEGRDGDGGRSAGREKELGRHQSDGDTPRSVKLEVMPWLETGEEVRLTARLATADRPPRPEGKATETDLRGQTMEQTLQTAAQYYLDVRRFLASVHEVSGMCLFAAHAAAISAVLFAAYYVIGLITSLTSDNSSGVLVQATGVVAYVSMFIFRLMLLSIDGSAIMQRNSALTDRLTDLEESALDKDAQRQLDSLLQKTKRPFSLDVMGFFTLQKSNVLSIFSFVLTYIVILMQMGDLRGFKVGPEDNPEIQTENAATAAPVISTL